MNKILQTHNEIVFEPQEHTYFYNGKYLTSGTKFISKYHKPFNKEEILNKQYSDPITKAKKRYEWDNSSVWGNYIHELLEIHYSINNINATEKEFIYAVNRVEEFIRKGYEIVGCEVRITNGVIAGTIDLLMFNSSNDKYLLLDFKTCKKLSKATFNNERFYKPLDDIEYNKFTKYSLQLSLYASILEDNYDVEVEDMFIIWTNSENEGITWRCEDLREHIRRVL